MIPEQKPGIGWKTILGCALIAVAAIAKARGWIDASSAETATRLGEAISLYGLRRAFTLIGGK